MTTENRELFELCKQVYEATGWENDPYIKHLNKAPKYEHRYGNASIYTSDYLLEKLPVYLMYSGEQYFFELEVFEDKTWRGNYGYQDRDGWYDHPDINLQPEDTPLKALLKLALKLHEEKIL